MKPYLFALIVACFWLSPFAYAWDNCQPVETVRFDRVARVFMNQINVFTLLVQNASDQYSVQEVRAFSAPYVHIVTDVPDDSMMYATVTTCEASNFMTSRWNLLVLHLHSTASIEGGGWQRQSGKTMLRGATQPLN